MSFLETFFGPGNRLRWAAIQAGTLPSAVRERLGPFLDDIRKNLPVQILPRVRESDGQVIWYVLCSSARDLRAAREEVRAFLGPTYSNFAGQPTALDPDDPVEACVLQNYGKNSFRLEIPNTDLIEAARERLRLLMTVRAERPQRYGRRVRATGRILRDFEHAILAGDGHAAADLIAELRWSSRLNPSNLLFLEIRRLDATHQWRAILALPQLGSLLATPRPRRVTEALIRAIYVTHLKGFEENSQPEQALSYFRESILPTYSELYKTRAGLRGAEIDVSFMLAAAGHSPARTELIADILSNRTAHENSAYLNAIASLVQIGTGPATSDELGKAREAFAAANIDHAFQIATRLSPSFEQSAILLRCAKEMGTLDSAQRALENFRNVSEADQRRLLEHSVLRRVYDALFEFTSSQSAELDFTRQTKIPLSWNDWLKRISEDQPWPGARSVAEAGTREWNYEAFSSDPLAVSEASELLLRTRPKWAENLLRDCLPNLVEFLLSRGANAAFRQLYDNIFLLLATDEALTAPQVTTLLGVAEARLEVGVDTAAYKEILTQLLTAIDRVESPSILGTALDAVESLISRSCPSPEHRQEFLIKVLCLFQRWYRRVDQAQWEILSQFCDELDLPRPTRSFDADKAEHEVTNPWSALSGKRLALYSLRESALKRSKTALEALCPGLNVEIYADHVGGSPALRTAARTVDLFVLATSAAKHAATTFIQAQRPKAKPTVFARGQGSASLLESVRNYLATLITP